MAKIIAWRMGRFWVQRHVPRHSYGCILVLSRTIKESPAMWRKQSVKLAIKKCQSKALTQQI